MEVIIKPGTILIAEGSILPGFLPVESEPFAEGWRLVTNFDSKSLEQLINQKGWNFIYIAGVIGANAYGGDEKQTAHKAIKQIIAKLRSKKYNCLEITQVTRKRSLGFPSLTVWAHSRHIQKSIGVFGDEEPQFQSVTN